MQGSFKWETKGYLITSHSYSLLISIAVNLPRASHTLNKRIFTMIHTDHSQTIDKKEVQKIHLFTPSQTGEENFYISILWQLRIQLLFVGVKGLFMYVCCRCWALNSGWESNWKFQELAGVALCDRKHALHIFTAPLASLSWKYAEVQLQWFLPPNHQFRAWFYTVAEPNKHPDLLKG